MVAFLIRRTAFAVVTTFFISLIAFAAIQLPPGDYATTYVQSLLGGLEGQVTPAQLQLEEQIREQLGLNKPMIVQYGKYAWRAVNFDFGNSLAHSKKITEVIGERLFNTVMLALGTIIFTWVLAIPIGIYSALRHNTPGDYAVTFVGFLGLYRRALMLMLDKTG